MRKGHSGCGENGVEEVAAWKSVVGVQVGEDGGLKQVIGSDDLNMEDPRYFRGEVNRHCLCFAVGL